MIGAGLPAALLYGVIVYYVSLLGRYVIPAAGVIAWIGGVVLMFYGVATGVGCALFAVAIIGSLLFHNTLGVDLARLPAVLAAGLSALIAMIGAAAVALFFPAVMGAMLAALTTKLAKTGKCRSRPAVFSVWLVHGAAAYLVFQLLALWLGGAAGVTSGVARYLNLAGRWLWFAVAVDALVFWLLPMAMISEELSGTPFCEHCQKWYETHRKGELPAELAAPLAESLDSGCLPNVEGVIAAPEPGGFRIHLTVWKCPSCNTNDRQLQAEVTWEEEKTERGKTAKKHKKEHWFNTMIPAGLALELENWLVAAEKAPASSTPSAG